VPTTTAANERHITITFTTVGTTAEATISLGVNNGLWELVYSSFLRSAGSAATYQPLLAEASAPVAASMEHCRLNYAAAIAVATVTRDQHDPPIPFKANALGQLFYRPVFNTGADNTATVVLRFRQVKGLGVAVAVT
jgi:hypothetical protein